MIMANKTADYEFTIVVPVYNEEDNMERLEKTLAGYLPKAARKACVLFVNDGSKDMSLEGIKAACERNHDFYYISFVKNCGLSAAIKAGFDYCESKLVGYVDADLQTAPEDFNLLLKDIDRYSMVIGIRANRKDSFFKNMQSKIANGFRKMMTHDGATDTGLVLLQEGGSYEQVPVRHFPRTAGKSKYHLWNRLIGPFNDCFAYRWMKPRYINYKVGDDNISTAGGQGLSQTES